MTSWKRTLTISVLVQLISAIGMSSIFPFLPLYIEDLGSRWDMSIELLAGLVFSVQAFTMMLAAPVWGALADRKGRKVMVERATIGGAILITLMGFVRSAEELVLLRGVQGLVTGVLSALTALVAANVPRERTGYALGLLQVGLWTGMSIGPLLGGAVADLLGYRAAFIATASLLALAGVLVVWGIDEKFEPVPKPEGGPNGFLNAWRHVVQMPGVPLTYASRFLSNLGRSMVMPFVPLFVQVLMPESAKIATITGVVTGLSAGAGALSAVYLGRLGDRIGHRRVVVGASLFAALFYFPQTLVTEVWQLLILQGLTGFAAGGLMPALSALLAGYTDPGEEGAVYGLESSIMSAARAIAPMLGAGLAGWFGLRSMFLASGFIFLALAMLPGRALPEPRTVPRRAIREPSDQPAK